MVVCVCVCVCVGGGDGGMGMVAKAIVQTSQVSDSIHHKKVEAATP